MTAPLAHDCCFRIETPVVRRGGAIAAIALTGDIDDALRRLRIAPVRVGEARLRDICGIDEGVVARWAERSAHLMPHGGAAVIRALADELLARGFRRIGQATEAAATRALYPEAEDDIEAAALDAMARAASPLAIDLLLDQPRRWREWDGVNPSSAEIDERSRLLGRLIDPPLVAAIGPTNIGKSTLLNALARREVSIVADQPGVTRDHVGATLDLAGLVVRWVDTPGVRADGGEIEREAIEIAMRLAAGADLVLSCGDASSGFLDAGGFAPDRLLRVGLRSDLGLTAGADIAVAAGAGGGVDDLARAVRERLLPAETLRWEGPWRVAPWVGASDAAGADPAPGLPGRAPLP